MFKTDTKKAVVNFKFQRKFLGMLEVKRIRKELKNCPKYSSNGLKKLIYKLYKRSFQRNETFRSYISIYEMHFSLFDVFSVRCNVEALPRNVDTDTDNLSY